VDALRLTPLDPAEVEVWTKLSPIAAEEDNCGWVELGCGRIAGVEEDADVVAREGSERGRGRGRGRGGGGGEVDGEVAVSASEGEESRECLPVATTRAGRGRRLLQRRGCSQ
jgi:hypothetical protein